MTPHQFALIKKKVSFDWTQEKNHIVQCKSPRRKDNSENGTVVNLPEQDFTIAAYALPTIQWHLHIDWHCPMWTFLLFHYANYCKINASNATREAVTPIAGSRNRTCNLVAFVVTVWTSATGCQSRNSPTINHLQWALDRWIDILGSYLLAYENMSCYNKVHSKSDALELVWLPNIT